MIRIFSWTPISGKAPGVKCLTAPPAVSAERPLVVSDSKVPR